MSKTITMYMGRVRENLAHYEKSGIWKDRIAVYRKEPDTYMDDEWEQGWFIIPQRMGDMFILGKDLAEHFLPLIPDHTEKPRPVDITFELR